LFGQITSGIYSPRLKKNVGLSMILKDHWNIGNDVIVETPDNKLRTGTISSLPFPE
jgi:dimethylsulfoniopropionate demethylase